MVEINPYLLWIIYFPLQLAISLFCKVTAPIACLFVTKRLRTDRVKVYGGEEMTFDREYLWGPFILWQTHDAACDEYYLGGYSHLSVFPFICNCTDIQYKRNSFIRYVYRVLWVWRNTAYGFAYWVFGRRVYDTHFQIKKDIPLFGGYFLSVNIGWKSNRSAPDINRLMYAGGLIRIRKNKGE